MHVPPITLAALLSRTAHFALSFCTASRRRLGTRRHSLANSHAIPASWQYDLYMAVPGLVGMHISADQEWYDLVCT